MFGTCRCLHAVDTNHYHTLRWFDVFSKCQNTSGVAGSEAAELEQVILRFKVHPIFHFCAPCIKLHQGFYNVKSTARTTARAFGRSSCLANVENKMVHGHCSLAVLGLTGSTTRVIGMEPNKPVSKTVHDYLYLSHKVSGVYSNNMLR